MTSFFCLAHLKNREHEHASANDCRTSKKNSTSVGRLYGFLAWLILSILASSVSAIEIPNAPPGKGYIDSVTFDGQRITAQGWVVTEQTSQEIKSIEILLGGEEVYSGLFGRTLRPDVAEIFHRPDWANSGWRVSFKTPDDLKTGQYSVAVVARTIAGEPIALSASAATQKIYIHQDYLDEKSLIRVVKLIIACSFLGLVACFIKSPVITPWINRRLGTALSEPVLFSTFVVLVSFLYVGMGLTGSSLHLGQASAPFIQLDGINIMGHDQPIRSDEWLVQTPFSIAQYNHEPRFPVVNRNVGEDGQNMMVTSMTSVPIAHITAFAKPATWGFFVFDLRRALSWNWCFPIVGCFLALAFVLNRLSDEHWKHGFLFSGLFCCAPYVVAWSYWPAYTVFFPCIIFLCALQILKTSSLPRLLVLGVLLGIAVAGFIFILYPPWQVSVGYVFIALTIGIVIREKLYRLWTVKSALIYALAAGVAAGLVIAWWLDATTAIQTMAQTVYPGQRVTVGGTASLPLLLRGFTNFSTLHQLNSTMSNQSEISCFYYLLLPLGVLVAIRALQKKLTALEWSLTAVCGLLLFYMFIGLPVDLARLSLWGRSAPYRADLALGLASLILTYLLFTKKNQPQDVGFGTKGLSFTASLVWIYIIYRSVSQLDSTITSGMTPNTLMAILLVTAAISYCLITNRLKPFVLMSLGLSLVTTASFHPINIASTEARLITTTAGPTTLTNMLAGKRVVVLENRITAMFLIATGVSVVNGINYFPQKTLWNRLDPEGKQRDLYNRYQHLTFLGVNPPARDFVITVPHPDVVMVTVNMKTFDFRLSGAEIVLAPDHEKAPLIENPHLSFVMSTQGWSWFTTKLL